MASDTGVKLAKGVLYILSRVVIVIIVIVLILISFYTAMDTMNVNMVVKDAFTQYTQAVLSPSATSSDMLENLFTADFLASDEKLNHNPYAEYSVTNYYHRTEMDTQLIWPWQNTAKVKITETVMDISGKQIVAEGEESDENAEPKKPPLWQNAVLEVELVKENTAWKVDAVEVVKVLPAAQEPAADASAQQ